MSSKQFSVSIIGCGRMGTFLAKILQPHARIQSLIARSEASAARAREAIGEGSPSTDLSKVESSDFYLIGVQEEAIRSCAEALAKTGAVQAGQIAFHVSGMYPSSLLDPLKAKGLHITSLHPDISVSDPQFLPPFFFATLEGDAFASEQLKKLFSYYPIVFQDINAKDKALYHTALVIASNFSLALLKVAKEILSTTALEETDLMLVSLLSNTLQTIQQKGLQAALSGPVSRGSKHLVEEQLALMHAISPRFGEIYRLMSLQILEMTEELRHLPHESIEKLRAVLHKPNS